MVPLDVASNVTITHARVFFVDRPRPPSRPLYRGSLACGWTGRRVEAARVTTRAGRLAPHGTVRQAPNDLPTPVAEGTQGMPGCLSYGGARQPARRRVSLGPARVLSPRRKVTWEPRPERGLVYHAP